MELGIYRKVEILNKDLHFNHKVTPLKNYQFSSSLRECVITANEFYECAKSLPILFTESKSGSLTAITLLGVEPEKNVMLDENLQWRAGEYIPAFLRRYPFVFVQNDNSLMLALDAASEAVNKDDGQALFESNGEATSFTKKVMGFMKDFQQSCKNTESIVATINELGLLEDAKAEMVSAGKKYSINGFKRVNEEKLKALSDEQTLELVRSGVYNLIVAHLMSLSNFRKLSVLAN
ncbi:SapC family protein [Catenovulum maritimum]|uniref:Multidrug transporter n=1 Tax=Catenovulum maritimum TaxID=1513271 RepID=A0A0J8GTJ5_9ALTE|nr:SapC family protein [Catenovulum maritimum]KMT66062.1 hypothetical protein XM47_06345 [Catenovulum maritimum]